MEPSRKELLKERMEYVLPDVLERDLDIVFCGTAAGKRSAQRQAYYAGPGNAFWCTLFKVGLTPHLFQPEEFSQLLTLRMGLTDLVKHSAGNDVDLPRDGFDCDSLKEKILKYRPKILAFTSKRAAHVFVGYKVDYGQLQEKEGDCLLFVLPSPSGAARRYWNEKPWKELAELRRRA